MFDVEVYTMIKQLFGKEKEQRLRNRNRQRQRMSRKMIIILGMSIVCLVIAFVLVINITNTRESKAALTGATSKNVIIMQDEVYPTALSQESPPAARSVAPAANVQFGHIAKPLPATK